MTEKLESNPQGSLGWPMTMSSLFDSWQAERAAAEALRAENAQLAKELLIARTQIAGLRTLRRKRFQKFVKF